MAGSINNQRPRTLRRTAARIPQVTSCRRRRTPARTQPARVSQGVDRFRFQMKYQNGLDIHLHLSRPWLGVIISIVVATGATHLELIQKMLT